MKAYLIDTEKTKGLKEKLQEFLGTLSDADYLALAESLTKKDFVSCKGEKAEVHFSEKAYYKMYALVNGIDKEIAWDGIVERDPEKPHVFYITDIIVYPQIVAAATVETDDEKYIEWMNSLDDDTFNKRRFNGHSHVNMGVTPSSTDMTYREQSLKNVDDFFIYGIFNKKGDFHFEVYDIENNIVYENSDVIFYTPEPDYDPWAKEQIAANITEHKYTTTYGAGVRTTGARVTQQTTTGAGYKPNNYGYGQQNLRDYYGGYYD